MHTYDIAGYQIRGLLDGLRSLQLDVDQILRAASVDRTTLEDPEARFAAPQVLMLWLHAQQRYAKPSFGFDVATRIGFGKLELIDYLVAACPTVGAGIECLVHHARLCASGFTYLIEDFSHEGVAGKRLIAEHQQMVAALPPSMAEYAWVSLVARFRQFATKEFAPYLWLRQRPQVSTTQLFEVLGRPPEIGEEALFIPAAQWELQNPRCDPMLYQLLAAHARDVAARLPEPDFRSVLEGSIVSTMHQGDPSIGRVAMRLGLTPRTLQRRLEAEGLSFQDVLEELRQEMAFRYLAGTQLSLTEISALLAYADSSAFGRAFRRWTGRSPAAYRQEQRAALPEAQLACAVLEQAAPRALPVHSGR